MKKIYKSLLCAVIIFALLCLPTALVHASSVDYPDITTKFDVNNMGQYSDGQLSDYVMFKNFYVQSISYDKQHRERIVFTNTPQSKDYYFTVLHGKHKKRLAVGDSVTIKGQLAGRTRLERDSGNSWFKKSLFGKKMIFVLTDSYK
mgnify:CR=1 FL=1|jgi:hypothetical protein